MNFPKWGNNWIHKTMKLRQCLITSMEKTFSKIHYIETVKSQWQKILKVARRWKKDSDPQRVLIRLSADFSAKLYRPADGGNDIQNFERLKTFIQEYSIEKCYHSDMKDEIKAFPNKRRGTLSPLDLPCKKCWHEKLKHTKLWEGDD